MKIISNRNNKTLIQNCFLLLILFAVIGCDSDCNFNSKEEVLKEIDTSRKLIEKDKFSSAIKKLDCIREAIGKNGDFQDEDLYHKATFLTIQSYLGMGDTLNADKIGLQWISRYPFWTPYKNLSVLYNDYSYYQKALRICEEGISKGFNLYGIKGAIYNKKGSYELAIKNFEISNENGGDYYLELADVYRKKNNTSEALKVLWEGNYKFPKQSEKYLETIIGISTGDKDYIKDEINARKILLKLKPNDKNNRDKFLRISIDNLDREDIKKVAIGDMLEELADLKELGGSKELEVKQYCNEIIDKLFENCPISLDYFPLFGAFEVSMDNIKYLNIESVAININPGRFDNGYSYRSDFSTLNSVLYISYPEFATSDGNRLDLNRTKILRVEIVTVFKCVDGVMIPVRWNFRNNNGKLELVGKNIGGIKIVW